MLAISSGKQRGFKQLLTLLNNGILVRYLCLLYIYRHSFISLAICFVLRTSVIVLRLNYVDVRAFAAMSAKNKGKQSKKPKNRVEPYLHFGKHTLRAFPTDDGAVFFTTKNMSEADYLKLSNIADNVLTPENEEFYLRPDIGASETFAMSDLVNNLQTSLDDDEKSGLHGLKGIFSDKKLLEAFAFLNLGNDYTRDEAVGLKHLEYVVNFWEKDSCEKGNISRQLMIFSARLFLASTALHKQNALINNLAAMAKALQGNKKLPTVFKDFCKRPNGSTLCKALLSALKKNPKWSKKAEMKASAQSVNSPEEEADELSSFEADKKQVKTKKKSFSNDSLSSSVKAKKAKNDRKQQDNQKKAGAASFEDKRAEKDIYVVNTVREQHRVHDSDEDEQMRAFARPVQALDFTADCHLLLETVQQVASLTGPRPGWLFQSLIGRRSKRALMLQRLPSFGKGSHRHKKFWRSLSYSLVDCGFLESAGKNGSRRISHCVSLTTDGVNALDKLRRGDVVFELQSLVPSVQLEASMQLPVARTNRERRPRESRRAKERQRRLG